MSRQNLRLMLRAGRARRHVQGLRSRARRSRRGSRRGRSGRRRRSTPSSPRRRRSRRKTGWRRRLSSTSRAAWTRRSTGQNGRKEPKIDDRAPRRARSGRSVRAPTRSAHPDEPVLLGIYEFSRRRGDPDCRPIVPMGPPDRERAAAAIARLDADGGTPIGQAMITAKRALDDTGLTPPPPAASSPTARTPTASRPETRRRGDRQAARRRAAVDLLRRLRRRGEPLQHASATPAASSSRPRTPPS